MFASNTSQVSSDATYIEDVFSTYLYTGNGSTQTITNGIDLAGKGGLVWAKQRNAANNHALFDTSRGTNKLLYSNTTSAQVDSVASYSDYTLTSFNSNGFTLGNDPNLQVVNTSPNTYASWTFRKQPKFFDIQTWTGDGAANKVISHNLNSTPGAVIIKRTDSSANWFVWHTSVPTLGANLNLTNAFTSGQNPMNTSPTSTQIDVKSGINVSGATYVAYLYATNAGGFGLTGTDNVISCGSYTGTGAAGNSVTLGYEPQLVLIKSASAGGAGYDWQLIDTMRGWSNTTATGYRRLQPNSSAAEDDGGAIIAPTATGFTFLDWTNNLNASGTTYIYIAIRRGPMKTPTSGTSVYNALTYAGDGSTITGQTLTPGISFDMAITRYKRAGVGDWDLVDRLRGLSSDSNSNTKYLNPYNTNSEATGGYLWNANSSTVLMYGFPSTTTQENYFFRRAPGFFDEVCYTGTGSATSQTHNLGVVPELIIVKGRSAAFGWATYSATLGIGYYLTVNNTAAAAADPSNVLWNNVPPTSTTFRVGTNPTVNGSGSTYVAYLFASCPGVSKVGSYTGNGSSQTINCGFTGGARFVMIKRTDSTGDWYVWDTARGIVSANDPRLSLNSTAAEVTTDDSIDPDNSGFIVNQVSATNINVSSATYIYLAIA